MQSWTYYTDFQYLTTKVAPAPTSGGVYKACIVSPILIPPVFSIYLVVRYCFCFFFLFSACRVLFLCTKNIAEFIANLQSLISSLSVRFTDLGEL